MYGCVEEVLIQDVVPCMPRGSRIMVSFSSSSVPRRDKYGAIKERERKKRGKREKERNKRWVIDKGRPQGHQLRTVACRK